MARNSRTVLVTGGQGALGSGVVKKFESNGWTVWSPALAEMDATSPQSIANACKTWMQNHSAKIDALVHCAGGFRYSVLEETSDHDIDFLINTNLKSAIYLLREVLPSMKEQNFGRIVLVSAKSTQSPGAGISVYAASKAGLNALVSSIAEETKNKNININAVMPTIIDTGANRKDMPQADFSKWVSVEALSEVIFSLVNDLGNPIHGALIPVAGRV